MKRNLQLLKKYRHKMAFVIASIITSLIMGGIFLDRIFLEKNLNKTENEILFTKMEWIKMMKSENVTLSPNFAVNSLSYPHLENVKIFQNDALIFDTFTQKNDHIPEKFGVPEVYDGNRFLADTFNAQGWNQTVILAIPTTSYGDNFLWMLAHLFLAGIFVGIFVLFLSYHLVDIFFHPTRAMVQNLEDFTGNISHEFRTSFAEIISSLEIAKMTKNYEKPIETAINASKRIHMILDSLEKTIYFVNADYRKENVNLIEIIENSLEEFAPEMTKKNLKIKKRYSRKKPIKISIDKESFLLVFRNIFKNAVKYSNENSHIELTLNENFFIVKDYGIGIEKENLENIFLRFFRESYHKEWYGIGLPLAKKIADKYDWEIVVESEKNVFTEVTCHFGMGGGGRRW